MLGCGPPIMKISNSSFACLVPLLAVVFAAGCSTPPKDPNVDDNKKEVKKDPLASTAQPADPKNMPLPQTSGAPSSSLPPTPTASSSATAAPSTSAGLGKSSACTTDADCRTFSSYCSESPCACRVLSKSDPDPTCVGAGPKVQCLVNPCGQKAAHCQSNVCVLVSKAPAGATTK